MKKTALLLVVAMFCGCAVLHPPATPQEGLPQRTAASHANIERELQVMAIGAMPPLKLRPLVFGTVRLMDQILKGNSPTASGQVPCATAADLATWQTAASCGLATGTNYWTISTRKLQGAGGQLELTDTTDELRTMGWTSFPATGTNVLRYQFGDAANGMQLGSGGIVQLYGFNGFRIEGGRASVTAPATVSGGAAADPSLTIVSSATGGGLRINSNGGSVGTSISFSGRNTVSPSAVSCAASTCTSLGSATITGAIVGAECVTSRTTTAGAIGTNATAIVTICGVTAANTVTLYGCNLTAGALAVTGTWSMRVFDQ